MSNGNPQEDPQGAPSEEISGTIRVVVVDDHPAIREALADTVDQKMGMTIAGQASSAGQAFEVINDEEPHVAIVDISLEDAHGINLIQDLRVQHPDLRIIIFSMFDENVYAERAIRAGASGYVMKSAPTQAVIDAIRDAARGDIYLSRRMASRILSKVASPGSNSAGPGFAIDELTDREMEVFQMLGEGATVDDIAERLNLSRKTVETYRRRAKEKLGLDSVSELLQYAIQWRHGQAGAE